MEIRIQFKDVTQGIFKDIARNELVLRIQPSEAVYLKLNAKAPGLHTRAIPTEMDLTYKRRFGDAHIPEAYESLILDALKGDHSNFVRDDELDVAWKVSFGIEPHDRTSWTFPSFLLIAVPNHLTNSLLTISDRSSPPSFIG